MYNVNHVDHVSAFDDIQNYFSLALKQKHLMITLAIHQNIFAFEQGCGKYPFHVIVVSKPSFQSFHLI